MDSSASTHPALAADNTAGERCEIDGISFTLETIDGYPTAIRNPMDGSPSFFLVGDSREDAIETAREAIAFYRQSLAETEA